MHSKIEFNYIFLPHAQPPPPEQGRHGRRDQGGVDPPGVVEPGGPAGQDPGGQAEEAREEAVPHVGHLVELEVVEPGRARI